MWLYLCLREIRLYSTLSPGVFPQYFSNFLFKWKKKKTCTYIYINMFKHVLYLFLVAVKLGKALLLMRFKIMVWWYWTYPCPVLISNTTVSLYKFSLLSDKHWFICYGYQNLPIHQANKCQVALWPHSHSVIGCPGFSLSQCESNFIRHISTQLPEIIDLFNY